MKRIVTITLEVDSTEYFGAEDTNESTIDVAIEMITGCVDLPSEIGNVKISCGDVTKVLCSKL